MQAFTRFKKFAGIGLLASALALSLFTGALGQHSDSFGNVPAAHAEGGAPPDLTGAQHGDPTPTATPTPIPGQ